MLFGFRNLYKVSQNYSTFKAIDKLYILHTKINNSLDDRSSIIRMNCDVKVTGGEKMARKKKPEEKPQEQTPSA